LSTIDRSIEQRGLPDVQRGLPDDLPGQEASHH